MNTQAMLRLAAAADALAAALDDDGNDPTIDAAIDLLAAVRAALPPRTDMNDLEIAMNAAHDDYIGAGYKWQEACIALLEDKVSEVFPTALWAEVTAIVDESYVEHSISVFGEDGKELTADQDFPPEHNYDWWWLVASEGAVFGEGDFTTIHFPQKNSTHERPSIEHEEVSHD